MSKNSGTLGKSIGLFGVCLIGMLFICFEASAQSENEKMEDVNPKPIDRPLTPIVDDHSTIQDNSNPLLSPALKFTPNKTATVKRDLPAGGIIQDKDPKKTDSPSTLSFNIFLYVVDKFKENNLRAD